MKISGKIRVAKQKMVRPGGLREMHPHAQEMINVPNQDRAQKIAATLANCIKELDALSADVAAAHIDLALQTLRRQFSLGADISESE